MSAPEPPCPADIGSGGSLQPRACPGSPREQKHIAIAALFTFEGSIYLGVAVCLPVRIIQSTRITIYDPIRKRGARGSEAIYFDVQAVKGVEICLLRAEVGGKFIKRSMLRTSVHVNEVL